MRHKAVLFDLDGTLLDTLEDLADSMNAALGSMGMPTHDLADYRIFVGDGVEQLARRSLPMDRSDERTIRRLSAAMREEYGRRWAGKTRPYEGIPRLLEELSERGVAMAVLSNKPDEFVQLLVGRFFPRAPFSAVRGQRPGAAKKPDPAEALDLAQIIGAAAAEFVYLGDTNTDMRTAVSAGMHPVGALWGFRSASELQASGAKELIARPDELLRLFQLESEKPEKAIIARRTSSENRA